MSGVVRAIDEFNDGGHLIYAENCTGAFARGRTREEALRKLPGDVRICALWQGMDAEFCGVQLVGEKRSELDVCDADSDVLFDSELKPLTMREYERMKQLALMSARDFLALYSSIPDGTVTDMPPRRTFYGDAPVTPDDMYAHTRDVNSYYFGEIGVDAPNGPDILSARRCGFEALEARDGFLENAVVDGSFGERWTLRKVCRRFVWHDRIHARAMWRLGARIWGADALRDPFLFGQL